MLSADSYCGHENILSHTFEGPAAGFVPTVVLYDEFTDTNGYIGYLPSDKSIYVVFRGSISIANWLTDFDATLAPYDAFPECNCQVHMGFQLSLKTVYAQTLTEVRRLMKQHPTYKVKTTGHSLGAALAQLCAMNLLADGVDTSMINFGQPRVGTEKYANFSNEKLVQYRVVHYKDSVPHVPEQALNYQHCRYEIYEDYDHSVRQCDATGEDPTCSDQWKTWQLDGNDHGVYLDRVMACGADTPVQFLQ